MVRPNINKDSGFRLGDLVRDKSGYHPFHDSIGLVINIEKYSSDIRNVYTIYSVNVAAAIKPGILETDGVFYRCANEIEKIA